MECVWYNVFFFAKNKPTSSHFCKKLPSQQRGKHLHAACALQGFQNNQQALETVRYIIGFRQSKLFWLNIRFIQAALCEKLTMEENKEKIEKENKWKWKQVMNYRHESHSWFPK